MTAAVLRPSRLPEFELRRPTSVGELAALVADGFRVYAGGSDILLEAQHTGEPRRLAATAGIADLADLRVDGGEVTIGSSVVLARLIGHEGMRAAIPAVIDGAQRIGSVQLRNTATLVGNICTASPAGDTVPGLFVHAALVDTIDGSDRRRSIPIAEFASGPGATALEAGEIVTAVRATPLGATEGSAYDRFTERNAIDLAFAAVAARVALEPDAETVRDVSLALGAVGPTVIEASEATAGLVGRAATPDRLAAMANAAAAICSPISDHRCSADYRRQLVRVLTVDVMDQAMARARARVEPEDPR